jgi:hypothetical protein
MMMEKLRGNGTLALTKHGLATWPIIPLPYPVSPGLPAFVELY